MTATVERQWASEVIYDLIHGSSSPDRCFDAGEFFASNGIAPFPSNELFYVLGQMANGTNSAAYAERIMNSARPQGENYLDLMYRNPNRVGADWNQEVLHRYAPGQGLLFARSDWSDTPIWLSLMCANPCNTNHQTRKPGQLQVSRGADMLLLNTATFSSNSAGHDSDLGNLVVIDANGDKDAQGRLIQQTPWKMSSGLYDEPVTVPYLEPLPNQVYAACDYKGAYGWSNQSIGVVHNNPCTSLTREVVFVRPNLIVMLDRVTTAKPEYQKQLRFHTRYAPTAFLENNRYRIDNGGSSMHLKVYSPNRGIYSQITATTYGTPPLYQLQFFPDPSFPVNTLQFTTAMEIGPTGIPLSPTSFSNDGLIVTVGSRVVQFGNTPGSIVVT